MSTTEKSLDAALGQIGSFGPYQKAVFTWVCIGVIINSIVHIAYVFTAMPVNYRCEIHPCETDPVTYNPEWISDAIPLESTGLAHCTKYQLLNVSHSGVCTFNKTKRESCNSFIYETDTRTILHDFSLQCDDNLWKLTSVGTINHIGQFISLPISGILSDRYGRRTVFIVGSILCGVAGLARAFSNSYNLFIIFEFFEAAAGAAIYSCGFILGVELVGPKQRVLSGTLLSCCYAIGEMITASIAYATGSWRYFICIISSMQLLLVFCFWLIPESVRWLLSKEKYSDATAILKRAAKTNKKDISADILEKLTVRERHATAGIANLFKSKILLFRFVLCSFSWITCTFLFYGISLNSVSLAGNPYLDFSLTSLVEIPGYFLTYLVVDRVGRRAVQSGSFLFTAVACITFILIPTDMYSLRLPLYLLGKFGSTVAFTVLYIISSELFPTPLRHSLIGACSMFGRFGSMAAPQMPLLAQLWKPLPEILFFAIATTAGFLALQFPETLNTKLPDTIAEAETIGEKRNK